MTPLPKTEMRGKMKTYCSNSEKVERARLKNIYKIKEGPKDPRWGLIKEAARLKCACDKAWTDISLNGTTEMFQQSEKQEPYERERPVVKQYQSFNKLYQTVIKQLNDSMRTMEADGPSIAELLEND